MFTHRIVGMLVALGLTSGAMAQTSGTASDLADLSYQATGAEVRTIAAQPLVYDDVPAKRVPAARTVKPDPKPMTYETVVYANPPSRGEVVLQEAVGTAAQSAPQVTQASANAQLVSSASLFTQAEPIYVLPASNNNRNNDYRDGYDRGYDRGYRDGYDRGRDERVVYVQPQPVQRVYVNPAYACGPTYFPRSSLRIYSNRGHWGGSFHTSTWYPARTSHFYHGRVCSYPVVTRSHAGFGLSLGFRF